MGVATFIIFIYLAAGFENGKGLGELLSPFNLYGFIFWMYIGFLVILLIALPNQKQGQEIRERLKKEEGEFKVLCWRNPAKALDMTFGKDKSSLWSQWYWDIYNQRQLLSGLAIEIERAEKTVSEIGKEIISAKDKIWRIKDKRKYYKNLWEMEEEIKEQEEIIKEAEERIKRYEEDIEKNTKKLNGFGYCCLGEDIKPLSPLPPLTWDDVYDYVRKERTMLWPKKIDKDED